MTIGELTNRELDRLDFVDNTIHCMLEELAGQEIDWNMYYIGKVVDAVREVFDELGIMTEMEFYPYLEE